MNNCFSPITRFKGRIMPEDGYLAGYAVLIAFLKETANQDVPLPNILCIIGLKNKKYIKDDWQVFPKSYLPQENIISHLVFALKYEGIDLYILKQIFLCLGEGFVLEMIKNEPTGQYARKVWFLYEWLLDVKLNVPDLETGTYIKIIDDKLQYGGLIQNSTRHRVKNNLPGTKEFCPLIRKTAKLEQYIQKNLSVSIEKGLSVLDKDLVRRTAAFLLLKDSKASFAIEGEYPPDIRARNWGKAIGQAGKNPLTIEEIERLQELIFGAKTLKEMGIRKIEGFIGVHDQRTFAPIPDHISAKVKDLPSLLNGLIETANRLQKSDYDAVLAAATIAFGFVFIHPLADGNGRIHRYLIHHILATKQYVQQNMIFPVSASILDKIAEYQEVLENFAEPRLELIEWKPSDKNNVEILNETIDLYRYYDITKQAEFLYKCVEDTIQRIIPEELEYLKKYDEMTHFINQEMALPNTKVDLLIKLLNQNDGKLSKTKRESHFDGDFTDEEILEIEKFYKKVWN